MVTKPYNKKKESGFSILDPKLKIFDRKLFKKIILSKKDKKLNFFYDRK